MRSSRYARSAGPVSSERVDRTHRPKLPKIRPHSCPWSGSVRDKDRVSEEPCAGSLARTVVKQRWGERSSRRLH